MGETRRERKPLCRGIPCGKAQHSMGNQSRVCGMLPAVCQSWSPQHGVINPHGAKSFLPGHTLCLGEKRGGACGKSLWERDTSVTLRATEAWLLRRHEGKIRAGERAPL